MVEELRLIECSRFGVKAFDLSGDQTDHKAICRKPEPLATAFGMMEAISEQKSRTSGFEKAVYVIQAGDQDICKIGVSANAVRRVGDLQGGHYLPLRLHAVVFCPTRKSVTIEKNVLLRAEEVGLRLCGEWVAKSPREVLDEIFAVAKEKRIPICDGGTWFKIKADRVRELRRLKKSGSSVAGMFSRM